jgi:hypothetical protein
VAALLSRARKQAVVGGVRCDPNVNFSLLASSIRFFEAFQGILHHQTRFSGSFLQMVRTLAVLTLTVLLCQWAGAQTATGILQGRIVDATGSAVPDAKVTIENETTGVAVTLTTNAEGKLLPQLPPAWQL